MLNPILLRSFDAVARCRSFTEAAARLRLSQSTISGHVARLEQACGRRLFVRDTHSVALTQDGEAMAGFARSVLDAEERARQHFGASSLRGRLRFGASEDLVLRGLPGVLRRFVQSHPAVDLELTVGLSGTLHEQLGAGLLDLIFVKRTRPGPQGDTVWRERLAWMGRPGTRVDPQAPVPLILLAPPSVTRGRALAVMEQAGRAWHVTCTSLSQSGIYAAALAGLGVAPHAVSLIPPELAEVEIGLPSLGEVDFVVLGSPGVTARALGRLILDSASVLKGGATQDGPENA